MGLLIRITGSHDFLCVLRVETIRSYIAKILFTQRSTTMPAYVVALLVIKDREGYNKYRAGVHDILDAYNGAIMVNNEDFEVIEGEWPYTKTDLILIEGRQ
jgi:hypothetical protein